MPRELKSIPWAEMRATFFADSTLTLVAVAKRFGVSTRLVRERAAVEKWRDGRAERDRRNGDELWVEAKRKIRDAAAESALALLGNLRRMNQAIAERYVEKLGTPELRRKVTQGLAAGSEGVPIGEQLEEEREVPVNLPRFAAKMAELELQAVKVFLGIESGAGLGGGGTATLKKTVEETLTFDLTQ